MESLEDRIELLEKKVAHLESELDVRFERRKFEDDIEYISPSEASCEISEGPYGYHARITDINGNEAQQIIDSIETCSDPLSHSLTETGTGLGIEVWTNNQ